MPYFLWYAPEKCYPPIMFLGGNPMLIEDAKPQLDVAKVDSICNSTTSQISAEENRSKRKFNKLEKEKKRMEKIKKKGKTNVSDQRDKIITRADVLWHQHSYDVVVLFHSCKPGPKQRHIFDFYATAGCGRAFMGEGVREKNSSSYGAIVMKAFEKFCRENSLKFRENIVDGNQAEPPATSSSPVEVNDDEMTFEDLSGLSSPLASTLVSETPLHKIQQEHIHPHTLQQADVTTHTQQRVSSDPTLPPPNRQEVNVQTPAQQRDISMPTPQMANYLEANSTTPAQQRGNSRPTTPTHTEGNALIHVQRRKNAVPTQPHRRSEGGLHNRVKDSGSVIFTETPGGIGDDSPPPSLTSITDAQLESDRSLITLVNSSVPNPMSCSMAKSSTVQSYNVGGRTTNCWVFPANISQSTIDGRNGSNACTVITMILGSVIQHLDLPFPCAGPLSQLWCSLIEKSIRLGNKIYDDTNQGRRNLTPLEASFALRSITNVHVDEPLAVRLSDPHKPTQLAYQIERMLVKKKSAAAFVQGDRSFLIMTEENGYVLAVDTHTHMNGTRGAVIVSSNTLTDMGSFIRAIEAVFSLEEDSFGNFVKFY